MASGRETQSATPDTNIRSNRVTIFKIALTYIIYTLYTKGHNAIYKYTKKVRIVTFSPYIEVKRGCPISFWTPLLCKNLYNKSYFEAARRLKKVVYSVVNEHFSEKADAEIALLERFSILRFESIWLSLYSLYRQPLH